MESVIDKRYRLIVLGVYLENVEEKVVAAGQSKWVFTCPFCGPLGRTEGKKKHRKAALLWNRDQNSWVFHCVKGGHAQCRSGKSLGTLIRCAVVQGLNFAFSRFTFLNSLHLGSLLDRILK